MLYVVPPLVQDADVVLVLVMVAEVPIIQSSLEEMADPSSKLVILKDEVPVWNRQNGLSQIVFACKWPFRLRSK